MLFWKILFLYSKLKLSSLYLDTLYKYIINLETWKPEKGYNSYIANKKVEDNIVVVPNNPVICVETGKVYKNVYSATKAMNLSSPFCITRVINNPSKRSRGYHWIQPEQPKEEIDNDIKA